MPAKEPGDRAVGLRPGLAFRPQLVCLAFAPGCSPCIAELSCLVRSLASREPALRPFVLSELFFACQRKPQLFATRFRSC